MAPPTNVEGDVLRAAICESAMVVPAAKAGTVTVLCAKEISAGDVGVTFAIAVKVPEEPDPAAVARAVPWEVAFEVALAVPTPPAPSPEFRELVFPAIATVPA